MFNFLQKISTKYLVISVAIIIAISTASVGVIAHAGRNNHDTVVASAVYTPPVESEIVIKAKQQEESYFLALDSLGKSQWTSAKNILARLTGYRNADVLAIFAKAEEGYASSKNYQAALDIMKVIPSDYSGDLKGEINSFRNTLMALSQPKPVPPAPKPVVTSKPTPAPATQSDLIVDKLKCIGNSQQVIVVTTNGWGTYHAQIQTFEKVNGKWQRAFDQYSGMIGKNGFSSNRHEGDYTTPTGVYTFGTAFGTGSNPGLKLPFRQSYQNKDFWVTDTVPERYNVWIHREEGPDPNWRDFEYMYQPLYKYGVVINFNMDPGKIIGKGAGIFFHIQPTVGTAGCVSAPEGNLLKTLRWMDPAKNPIIVMGPSSLVNQW